MKIEKLNRGESEKAMSEWINNYPNLPIIGLDYAVIRSDLTKLFQSVLNKANEKGIFVHDPLLSEAYFSRFSPALPILSHLFSLCLSSYYEVRGAERRLACIPAFYAVQSLLQA